MATKKFRCNVCGYIHEGDAAPESCPVCCAPASEFTQVSEKKKGLLSDTNSNAYILLYSTVMVVVVATLLAVAALALQSRQNANILNEKKEAILSSLGADGQNYDQFVTAYAVNPAGEKIETVSGDDALQMLFDLKAAEEAQTYPVFEAADGRLVVPVNGTGLWGPIWGYVALEKDMNTIAGVVFGHQGETPGLGAEIATPKHWAMYPGKTIYDQNGEYVSVKLRKGGAKDPAHEVDAISGGTKTSDGVTNMLHTSLGNYLPLFEARRAAAAAEAGAAEEVTAADAEVVEAAAEAEAAAQVSNDENVENNE